MATLDERIKKEKEKLEQLKKQKQAQVERENVKKGKIDTRRKIIAGAILLDIFPQFMELQPKRNNEENFIEFAPLADFLKKIKESEK